MKLIGYWILLLGCLGLMALGCSAPKATNCCPTTEACPCCPKAEDLACRCGPKCNCVPKKGETCIPCPRKCNPTCPGCHKAFEVWAPVQLRGQVEAANGILYLVDGETGDRIELDFSKNNAACRRLTAKVVELEWAWAGITGEWASPRRLVVTEIEYDYESTI